MMRSKDLWCAVSRLCAVGLCLGLMGLVACGGDDDNDGSQPVDQSPISDDTPAVSPEPETSPTPADGTPSDATPDEGTPEDLTPDEATPADTTPEEGTPDGSTPTDTTPDAATPVDTTPADTTPWDQTPDEPFAPIQAVTFELEFGTVAIDSVQTEVVTIRNTLVEAQSVTPSWLDGTLPFALQSDAPVLLEAGAEYSFTVEYAPTSPGDHQDTLLVTATDSGYLVEIPVSGAAVAADDLDWDGDGYSISQGDCDDQDPSIHPSAAELCDGLDNDCDDQVDEETPTWYVDSDADGFGVEDTAVSTCDPGAGYATLSGDCNDADDTIHPDASEVCNGTDDNCDGAVDEGLEVTTVYVDADGDGYGSEVELEGCIGAEGTALMSGDCDDTNLEIYPGATEVCDGLDSDCDGAIDEDGASLFYVDNDGDGHGDPASTVESCDGEGLATVGDDCDDGDATVFPGAEELCDNQDNNCDGAIDEGAQSTFYEDYDADGFGNAETSAVACEAPSGYVTDSSDCRDTDSDIHPEAEEICNGEDDNCDGTVDEEVQTAYYTDQDGDGYGEGEPVYACDAPELTAAQSGDCDDSEASAYPGAEEVCDEIDNNCDGQIDEGVTEVFYLDTDQDGFGQDGFTLEGCTAPDGFATVSGDCNDQDADIYPTAQEACDGKDNDCDSVVDEDGATYFYRDFDNDGFGDPTVSILTCQQQTGYVSNSDDCNDANAAINPDADEICNGQDDNCNSSVDEDVQTTYYLDADADGFGRDSSTTQACSSPSSDYVVLGGDCDDLNATIYPGAQEVCNEVDDSCDGTVDEGVQTTYYIDGDGDGQGSSSATTQACAAPDGYVANATDCDDAAAQTYQGADELCDYADNNCDGVIDEDAKVSYYLDIDGDDYGQTYATLQDCEAPAGYAELSGDCNDNDTSVNPAAAELCDGKDNNCDGEIDEGTKTTYYFDADGDGYGDATAPLDACDAPSSRYVVDNTDCDDLDASLNPGMTEVCNGYDDNCDGVTDDVDWDGDGYIQEACGGTDCDDYDAEINIYGLEVCDGEDNDCNGQTDEVDPDIDFLTDSNNCGGCFIVCGQGGEGPFCNDGSCGSLPIYQNTWKGATDITAIEEWQLLAGSEMVIRTKGGPLEIDMDIPIRYGGLSTCRPTVDGVWAGSFEGLSDTFAYLEGQESTGFSSLDLRRRWRRTRVYNNIPEGDHSIAVECRTDANTLEAGRSNATSVLITREYLGDNQVHQQVSYGQTTTPSTDSMVKLTDSDLTFTTTQTTLEVTISLPIGEGGHAGCLEFMDGAPLPASPAYVDTRWYAGLETTYSSKIMWHHTRMYTDVPIGTHTFSIRCYNDSGTLRIGYPDMGSVIIVKEVDEALYPSQQVVDAYGNAWEVSSGTDSKWYDLPHYALEFEVTSGTVEIEGSFDFYYVAAQSYVACRPMIDDQWAGTYEGLAFNSNEEEGAVKEYYNAGGRHGMWHRKRIYTGIPSGTHTFGYQCLSDSSGFYIGYYSQGTMMVREIDLITY